MSDADPQYMRQPCTMQLVIEAAGLEAFSVRQTFEIWTGQWPEPGQLLPVTFDREHHDRIKVHWDQIPTSSDVAAQDADRLTAELNAPTVPAPAGDPLERFEKLAALHSSGALTDAEFAAQKAKILESM